jgi:hypothetical protein
MRFLGCLRGSRGNDGTSVGAPRDPLEFLARQPNWHRDVTATCKALQDELTAQSMASVRHQALAAFEQMLAEAE